MIKRQIPNLITLGNLMCGVESIFASLVTGNVTLAAIFICAGIFLDFFDGLAARLLGVASPLGKELDSLADVVTSGIAPAFIMFRIVEEPMKEVLPLWGVILIMLPFVLMPAFAAYRLAKFNIDTRQSHSFLGLPVPSNALLWVGFALAGFSADNLTIGIILAIVAMITNILMISEMPMFSLKVNLKDMSWKANSIQYFFLIGCAVIIAACRQWYAISLIILWYIVLSAITQRKHAE